MGDMPIDQSLPSFAAWDAAQAALEIQAIAKKSVSRAAWYMGWYANTKRGKARWSKFIRATCVILFILTALVPLYNLYTTSDSNLHDDRVLNLGYIFAALGAGLLFLDKFYGFSTGWVRINAALTELGNAKRHFEVMWQTSLLFMPPDKEDNFKALLEMINTFDDNISAIVKTETDQWMQEFQAGNQELSQYFKTQLQEQRSGDLQVNVTGYATFTTVQLYINNDLCGTVTGGTRLVPSLAPDNYQVSIHAINAAGGDPIIRSAVATVKSGTLSTVELKLS